MIDMLATKLMNTEDLMFDRLEYTDENGVKYNVVMFGGEVFVNDSKSGEYTVSCEYDTDTEIVSTIIVKYTLHDYHNLLNRVIARTEDSI